MQYLYALALVLSTAMFQSAQAQTTLNAVYAGIETRFTINGVESIYQSYYFKQDGTYCYELNKPTWKTIVNGTYKVNGKKVTLVSAKSGKPDDMELRYDYLADGATLLFKYDVMNSIPAGGYQQVRDDGMEEYSFDGKGHFIQSGYRGASGLSKNSDFDGEGSYTIQGSVLALKYSTGKTENLSFFYSGGKSATALINGSIYNAKKAGLKKESTQKPVVTDKIDSLEKGAVASNKAAADALKKANLAHGGAILDSLHTAVLKATVAGAGVVQQLDFDHQKIRIEIWQGNQLKSVEQVEGASGWQWKNKKSIPLSASRIKEMQATFTTGIPGLRTGQLNKAVVRSFEERKADKMKTITLAIDGKENMWILDSGNRLVAELTVNNNVQRSTISKDFKTIKGVVLPFAVVHTEGANSFTVNYSSADVNVVLPEKAWDVPE